MRLCLENFGLAAKDNSRQPKRHSLFAHQAAQPRRKNSDLWFDKINLKIMKQSIAHIAVVVADYDEAIKFYTEKLDFELVEDEPQTETKRWVLVAPKNSDGCQLLLAKAVGEEQTSQNRKSNRRARFSIFTHRRFLARLRKLQIQRREIRPRTEKRRLRNGRRFCRFIRQSLGFDRVFK